MLSCGVMDFTGDINSDKTSLTGNAGLLLLGRCHVQPGRRMKAIIGMLRRGGRVVGNEAGLRAGRVGGGGENRAETVPLKDTAGFRS